jgi:ParB family chromosome partitioning protein
LAEKKSVPVILQDLNDKATLEIAIIENVQRADLKPIEEAEAYQRLVDEFKLSHQQIAEKVGKERATVSNAIRLLGLAPVVRQMLLDGKISSGHAKVLLSVKEAAAQSNLGNKVIQKGLSVRALEALLKEPDESRPAKMEVSSELRVVQSKLQSYFGSKVEVKGQENSGQLVIHFFSRDELSTLLEKLMG